MKAGKVSEAILKRTILKQLNSNNENVILSSAVGEDCSRMKVGEDEEVVFSVNPITMPIDENKLGERAVYRAFNNVRAKGARPVAILVSLLVPTSFNEQNVRTIIKQIDAVAGKLGAQVIGGHTECTRAVCVPIVTVTGVGLAKKDKFTSNKDVIANMDVIVTNWIGMDGTLALVDNEKEQLLTRFAEPFLDRVDVFEEYLSIEEEAKIAYENGAVTIHDISEGGILGALWELAEGANVGLEIDSRKIPIKQETIEICEFFKINPYKLSSMGSALIIAKNGSQVVEAIKRIGKNAEVVGRTTDSKDRVLLIGDERRFLETPQTDEIRKVLVY
ncbi:AIR synthase related protein [Lachnobacterium bovis]|uniref:AIR synthase related protein n=1 Tax=Lachnobacterium bovis TaxID=140626 RepID=UPI000489894C|nr:AIR synthase related protein [Lachnobacterium bovis]